MGSRQKKELILISGLPGVGKYSIAKEISENKKCILLHNHHIFNFLDGITYHPDMAKNYDGTFWEGMSDLWEFCIKYITAQLKKGGSVVITTALFSGSDIETKRTENFVGALKETAHNADASFLHVSLSCAHETHMKRIESSSRSKLNKFTDTKKYNDFVNARKHYTSKQLDIDTTNFSIHETVRLICNSR